MLYDTFPRDANPELTKDPLAEVYHQDGASGVVLFYIAEDGFKKGQHIARGKRNARIQNRRNAKRGQN